MNKRIPKHLLIAQLKRKRLKRNQHKSSTVARTSAEASTEDKGRQRVTLAASWLHGEDRKP